MAKRFKLKFSLPSFQFCRSKNPSTFPLTPTPAIYRLSPFNPKAFDISYPYLPAPPPSTPEQHVHPSIKRHVSSNIEFVGCSCRSRSCRHYETSDTESQDYTWKKHVVAKAHEAKYGRKIYDKSNSRKCDGYISPILVNKNERRGEKEKKAKVSACKSVSSGDSGQFSSEGEEDEETETETLLSSSRSFSKDSSIEFDHSLETIAENTYINESGRVRKKKKVIGRLKRHVSMNRKGLGNGKSKTVLSPESESPVARASVLRPMMSRVVDGKVRESVAVVKKSEDPYEDFKRSMLEMILDKQMFESKDLEQLLQCFLSLNSRHYHGVIVEAFSEIWDVLFCDSPVNKRVS